MLLALRGYATIVWQYEIVYSPVVAYLAIWPLYHTGIVDSSFALALLFFMCLPMLWSFYQWQNTLGVSIGILVYIGLASLLCFNDLSKLILSTLIPGLSASASILVSAAALSIGLYAVFYALAFIAAYAENLSHRRRRDRPYSGPGSQWLSGISTASGVS